MRFWVGVGVGLACLSAHTSVALAADTKTADTKLVVATVAKTSTEAAADKSNAVPVTQAIQSTKPKHQPPSLVARIDLNGQRMRVTSNGKLVGNWKISSGKSGHETPPGRFRPKWSSKMHYSRKYYNSPMPYSVFFNGGIATHGTTATGRLGRPASHGCIRLRTANARKFYELVHRHGYRRTRIIVTGRANTTRTASRRSTPRRTNRRRNSFSAQSTPIWNSYSAPRRRSLRQYDRARAARHQRRVSRYYQSRRQVFPGDRY